MINLNPDKHTVAGVKAFLKNLAVIIRISKILRKEERNQNLTGFSENSIALASGDAWDIARMRNAFRLHHIAYCEFRGKLRSQIEAKTDNPPNDKSIEQIKVAMQTASEELLVTKNLQTPENADAA